MPVFQSRNDDSEKFALFTAGFVLLVILAAALLTGCAKVETVEQNDNAPILIDDPVSVPAIDPVIITNDAAANAVTNEATNQGEASEQPR